MQYVSSIQKKIKKSIPTLLHEQPTARWINYNTGLRLSLSQWKSQIDIFYELYRREGKLIRPLLCCLTYHALGGREDVIYEIAPIIETIHQGTLLIDDVMDNSHTRRGKKSIHQLHGTDQAISTGFFLCYLSQQLLAHSPLSNVLDLYDLWSDEMTLLSTGQLLDVSWSEDHTYDVSAEQCLDMYAKKTGSLFSMAMLLGAHAADTSVNISKLRDFGYQLGTLFQLNDDLLNLTNSQRLRKDFAEDIMSGKMTYLIASLLSKASNPSQIKSMLNRRDVNGIIVQLSEHQILSEVREVLQRQAQKCDTLIDELFSQSAYRNQYHSVIKHLVSPHE